MKKQHVIPLVVVVLLFLASFIGYKNHEPDKGEIFYRALKSTAGIGESATDTVYDRVMPDGTKVAHSIVVNRGNLVYVYMRFDDENKAASWYDIFDRSFDAAVQSMTYKGGFTNAPKSYVLFNGSLSKGITLPEKTIPGGTTIYGGFFVKEDYFVSVYTVNGTDAEKQNVDDFLDKIGYKKPSR